MSKTSTKSFAEEGLELVQSDSAQAEATIPVSSGTAEGVDDGEEEMQQVGGLEPVSFFYRTKAPKNTSKHPFKILEKGESIRGRYERQFTTGKYKNPTYVIRLEDGKLVGLPGTGSLNRAMGKLAEGSKVIINYDGMSTIKGGEWAGSDAHNFTVFGNKLKAS